MDYTSKSISHNFKVLLSIIYFFTIPNIYTPLLVVYARRVLLSNKRLFGFSIFTYFIIRNLLYI